MVIGIINETTEARVAIVPEVLKKIIAEGNTALFERGSGEGAYYSDSDYEASGATAASRDEVLGKAEVLISIHPLEKEELKKVNKESLLVSSFMPFATDKYLKDVSEAGLSALSLDMIPRTTLAQAMDILSSMASIAGYKAVLLAASKLPRYFPMLTTAAGSIPPAKVLILGAGVAGLQAIATARRLGTVVEAFDTRPASKEEVESLGAKFVEVEGAADASGAGGYAVEQSEEYKQKQRALIAEKVQKADVVITTAQLRGRPAPKLVTKEMLDGMKPGSVLVDLAASSGGNVEFSKDQETVEYNNLFIIGDSNLSATVPQHASQLYAKNIHNYFKVFLKEGKLEIDMQNEIMSSSYIVEKGNVLYGKEAPAAPKPAAETTK